MEVCIAKFELVGTANETDILIENVHTKGLLELVLQSQLEVDSFIISFS